MFGEYENIIFKDRKDAGQKLGLFLEAKYKGQRPLIIGIPRGGVEVAYYVAKQLNADLSLIVSKKLPLPNNKEYGIGAIAEENSIYIAQPGRELVSEGVINQIIKEQKQEVDRRVNEYRHGEPLPIMKDRVVILVDDGIATGVTLVPVLELCKKKKAAKVIIAAPVSGSRFDENLYKADEIEIMVKPQPFYAVGQVYEVFGDFNDRELLKLLAKRQHDKK